MKYGIYISLWTVLSRSFWVFMYRLEVLFLFIKTLGPCLLFTFHHTFPCTPTAVFTSSITDCVWFHKMNVIPNLDPSYYSISLTSTFFRICVGNGSQLDSVMYMVGHLDSSIECFCVEKLDLDLVSSVT